jgi:Periplasmic serine proteases (ClpP class)
MAGWDEILKEITSVLSPIDNVRKKYLSALAEKSGRNVIAYYSSFMDKEQAVGLDITDDDINFFMNAVHGLDVDKGLDLILHTPGGRPTAAEAIVKYLRSKFGTNIRAIVPQISMSAGTMIACSAKSIVMGKHSCLGPIDPQFGGIPAYNIIKEYTEAKTDLTTDPRNLPYWQILLSKYPAAMYYEATNAIALSTELVESWLGTCMFDADADSEKIKHIVETLNEHDESKLHGRHFMVDTCEKIGLKIERLEDNQEFQDAVLSVHHSFMHTLTSTACVKIVENHDGKLSVVRAKM